MTSHSLRIAFLVTASLTLNSLAAELPKLDFGSVREEHVSFPLPRELRVLAPSS